VIARAAQPLFRRPGGGFEAAQPDLWTTSEARVRLGRTSRAHARIDFAKRFRKQQAAYYSTTRGARTQALNIRQVPDMKVLLVVIDAASPRVVCPAIQTGQLRHLKRIADAGSLHQSSVSIFPSITPAATTAIVTGAYPAENGIAGASWYDPERREVAYYGDDFWVIAKKGFGAFLRDFLVRLNGDRMKVPTLFELIEQEGRRAACLNYLAYRGKVSHRVNVPWLMRILPGVPLTETVQGPSILSLGDFVTGRTRRGRKIKDRGGVMRRFGMDDDSTAIVLRELASRGLPDFTLAYFAENDYRSHKVGPHKALPVIERVDAALGRMFAAAGGADRFLRNTCVIVTSDHGHCEILADGSRAVIRLDHLLSKYRQADIGRGWRRSDEIMICPNMRAAQVYLRDTDPAMIEGIVKRLLVDLRIDLVLRQGPPGAADTRRYLATSQRGHLEFWRGSDEPQRARDAFGTEWAWRGEDAALQLDVQSGVVESLEYPNAFERIAGALDAANSGDVWVTAVPGCEFELPGGVAHVGGGSHGALHALDSLSPVVIGGAGAPKLPRSMRIVDLAPLCMQLLGLPNRYRVGDPRGSEVRMRA
jgi:predicted AlkP superfamily pyrophosphatase or phosphodiesterase